MTRIARSLFTDEEILAAWAKCPGAENRVKRTAYWLTKLDRGTVSKDICRYWLRQLKVIDEAVPSTPRGKYKPVRQSYTGPRVLLLDIETSPIEGRVWGLWKQNVGLNQIVKEWNILSYCAKWLGDDKIEYRDLRDAPNVADDSSLVEGLYELLNQADIVVAQNGKRFDVPKIQARFVLAGYKPPRPFKIVDTLLMAKQQFGFTSNKLEWMTDKLCTTKKRKHEKFPGMELWNQCLAGNPEAWEEMELYNIDDVVSMEELYLILRPWYVGHPNVAVYHDGETVACPKCGSHDIKQEGWSFTQSGKYEQMHCGGCGGWSRGRYTRNSTKVRKAQLSN
jgi:uncharacterized protein YprB with RNaseH-like and TPR domain